MLVGVLDANVAIGLAKGGVFPLLRSIYSPLFVPEGVVAEVVHPSQQLAGAVELSTALNDWITPVRPVVLPPTVAAAAVTPADRQVIAVALDRAADHLLSGDERLRRVAAHHGITCLSATELVVIFKLTGKVDRLKPVLDQMRNQGFGVEDAVYRQALNAVGE